LQKYWADALPKKGETVQDQRSERPIHYKYGDDRKGDEPQGQIEVPVRDKNNVAAEEQESPPAVEAPQRPSLDELIQKIAEYERAYFPFHMKSIETFRMNEGLAAEERDRYPWGDGRKHARLLEYAQKADWIWVRKETQVLDDKPAGSRSEWYSDGDREVQFPNASPNSPLQADVFIERDRTRIGKWTYATPTAGIFPLTAFSNGDLFTSVFPRGRQVQLAWDDGDARLTFEFGPGRIHTRYELWLSRNHDWHPVRLRRYMRSDAMAFFDEWSVTKFAKREGRWRVAEGTVRYHDHQDAASPDAKLMYSVDFKVLEAEWGKLLPDELFKYKIPQGANIRERVASGRRADD
jgi:hypothetical protein